MRSGLRAIVVVLGACSVFPEHAALPGSGSGGDSVSGSAGTGLSGGVGGMAGSSAAGSTDVAGTAAHPGGAASGGAVHELAAGSGGTDEPLAGTNSGAMSGQGGSAGLASGGSGGAAFCADAIVRVLEPVADSWITEAQQKGNFGDAAGLEIGSLSGELSHALVRFDLSPIVEASYSGIFSAELGLELRTATGEAREIGAHRLARDWRESRVSWREATPSGDWAAPGGDAERVPVDVLSIPLGTAAGTRLVWNVSADVRADMERGGESFGWLLAESAQGRSRVTFASREAPSGIPTLTVVLCP